jgi:hypothetical protein
MSDWQTAFDNEIARAEQARRDNNEGMARVCARRAAGHVVGAYLAQRQLPDPTPSAYDRLRMLCSLPDAPSQAQDAAQHLLLRLTPEHVLPVEADLIAEARKLRNALEA